MMSQSGSSQDRRSPDDVHGDRRRDAAACAPVLHHAGDGRQSARGPRPGGGRRDRSQVEGAEAGPLDHLFQRSRRAVLSQRRAAVHRPCRRGSQRRVRRTEIPLAHPERDRIRDRASALSAEFRPRLHQHRQDRLCDRHSLDASRPGRPGPSHLRQCLSAAAADDGAVLFLRTGRGAHRTALGLKTVILSSGGMSHFPGTERYANPELAWDKRVLDKLAAGNLKSLIGYDESELDETGNIELRCWACAAGALGERKPDIVSLDPSWHHNYASLGWTDGHADAQRAAHYPAIKPELVELTSALHSLAHDPELRAQYLSDAAAFANRFQLPQQQRRS